MVGDVEKDGAGICFVEGVVGDFGEGCFGCVRFDGSKSSLSMIFFKPIDVALGDVRGF